MEELKQDLTKIRDEAQSLLDQLEEKAEDAMDDAKEKGNSFAEKVEHLLIDVRKHIDPNYSEVDAAADKLSS